MNTPRIPRDAGDRQTRVRDWLQAMHTQFQNIANQGEMEVIATYQTADATDRTHFEYEVKERAQCVERASKARMHALVERATSKEEKRRLRKVFLEATGDGSFQRLWFW